MSEYRALQWHVSITIVPVLMVLRGPLIHLVTYVQLVSSGINVKGKLSQRLAFTLITLDNDKNKNAPFIFR